MSKKLICLLVATFMAISMSGCGSKDAAKGDSTPASQSSDASEDNKEGTGELTEVTVSTVPWPTNMLFYLADEKGIYEKNGLKVTVQEFASTTESSNSFVGGKADFCTYASSETIAAFVSGADFSIVLETDKSNGCEGIVAKPEIKTPKDLKGKTIATQLYSVDHMLLLTLLDENGMSEKDVNIVDMSIQESGNAFVAGQCDAASIWDPYFSKAKAAGGTELYSTRDNPDIITDVLAASGELCREKPEVVEAMIKSYFEAYQYWEEHKEEASTFMGEKLGVDAEEFNHEMEGLIVPTVEGAIKAFTPAEDYTYWAYTQNKVLEFMRNLGVIDEDVDCGEMVDVSFVEAIKE